MALRGSTKMVLIAGVLGIGAYLGWNFVSESMVMRKQFKPIQPGEVSLLGVDTSAGYYIVVANQVAQIIMGSAPGGEGRSYEEATSGATKKRVPIRELVRSMQGDAKAVGPFVMRLNDLSDAELPAYPRLWKAEELAKALGGDAALRQRLENDLNVDLKGRPLERIRIETIQEGIVIESPVTLRIRDPQGNVQQVTGHIREEYHPRFMRDLDRDLSHKPNQTPDMIRGYYIDAARRLGADNKLENQFEDVAASLRARIDPKRLEGFATLPQKILDSIVVVLNDSFITGASFSTYKLADQKTYHDLKLQLNGEGRDRIWQYSRKHRGHQLLLVWDGVAIAAPRIAQEIPFPEVTITQLKDETLVRDTIAAIEKLNQNRKTQP